MSLFDLYPPDKTVKPSDFSMILGESEGFVLLYLIATDKTVITYLGQIRRRIAGRRAFQDIFKY